jgi:hypothetical protein
MQYFQRKEVNGAVSGEDQHDTQSTEKLEELTFDVRRSEWREVHLMFACRLNI